MGFTQRYNWIMTIVTEMFGIRDYMAEEFFKDPKNKDLIDAFLNGEGPNKIFFFYQPPYKIIKEKDLIEETGTRPDLIITTAEDVRLKEKGIYFIRTVPEGQKVNQAVATDHEVLFGEVTSESISAMETILTEVFMPMINNQTDQEWGVCEDESKKEFLVSMKKFGEDLTETINSLHGGIELRQYDKKYETETRNVNKNPPPEAIKHFFEVFSEWNIQIKGYMEDSDVKKTYKESKDPGPLTELEYWRNRQQKLTRITEQMKSRECKLVYEILTAASKNSQVTNKNEIAGQLQLWKDHEIKLVEALNEAKDNVKYLRNLEMFVEPLYSGTPQSIIDSLPALMNSIKMIHTIARYYNKSERMTQLFIKITNQMITNCKKYITKDSTIDLWDTETNPPEELIPRLEECIKLNKEYKEIYSQTKQKLANTPKGKQFDFSESQIFGKFDLFCRRIKKLIELFGTIQQFQTLGRHNLEGIDKILNDFNLKLNELKKHNTTLLDSKSKFDRDFVEFNVEVANLETYLQQFINTNFEVVNNIEHSIKFLKKFESMLKRETLKHDLKQKYIILFHNYGIELHHIDEQYGSYSQNPPLQRNMPTVAGTIKWTRHLYERIYRPLKHFPADNLKDRESQKNVRLYASIAKALIEYEINLLRQWESVIDNAKAGLQATLLVRHPKTEEIHVNFDNEIMILIREAKCLSRMGIDIKESAKIVLLQEEKFKSYYNELHYLIKEYDRIVNKIRTNTKRLLVPHIEDLEYKMRPGMVTLTWTSMNIDGYLSQVHMGLNKLEQLIININDIMDNRIENNLKAISKISLVDLPTNNKTFSLDDFVDMQEKFIEKQAEILKSKNIEVEGAVEDLVKVILNYKRDAHAAPISAEELQKLTKYYTWSMYQALLHATKYSLNAMKERVCDRRTTDAMPRLKPFFVVEITLEQNRCRLFPTLEDIQKAINRAANAVLKSTKHVENWNQKDKPEEEREPFYDWIAKDKEIVKVILLLTGSIQGTKNKVNKFLDSFQQYDWLWNKDIEDTLTEFNAKNPSLDQYEEELKKFEQVKDEIDKIESVTQIGAMALHTGNLKDGLSNWIIQWKKAFSHDLHKKAKARIETLLDKIKQMSLRVKRDVKDIDTLGIVMKTLEEIRQKESEIDLELSPVDDMYNLIQNYLPNLLEKDEMETQESLRNQWKTLLEEAEQIKTTLQKSQNKFKKELIVGVRNLQVDVKEFRLDFEKNGPMVPNISPKEALDRLKRFSEEYQVRKRKFEMLRNGETLFNLTHKEYPELDQTKNEITLLQKLYNLYSTVLDTIAKWKDYYWSEINFELPQMKEQIEKFQNDCLRLPGKLKEWPAYDELKTKIEEFIEILPLVTYMAQTSVRERHWEKLKEIAQIDIPYKSESFTLANLLEVDLIKYTEEIEELGDSAEKQLKIETQLRDEISKYWEDAEFEIISWQKRETPCVLSGNRAIEIQEKIEEHMMLLTTMNAMRHVAPFKQEVTDKLFLYSDVSDVIDKWLKVQGLWTSLESVFKAGDIAKQMPVEAKKFAGIDKNWLKIMERANENKNVITCCTNDMLKSFLVNLQEGLEMCQKKLENYLEAKRKKFPRFYFVSNPVLLKILSQGSDLQNIQMYFENLFDAISEVKFDSKQRNNITQFMQKIGSSSEVISMVEAVKAEGNIEEWLGNLEKEMRRTMKEICSAGAITFLGTSLDDLPRVIDESPAQVALLGIQILWTSKVEDSLKDNTKTRTAFPNTKEFIKKIMEKLTDMCLSDIPTKLARTKIETLVTIHVHQKDLFDKITEGGSKSKDDFEWQQNARFYYKDVGKSVVIKITDVDLLYCYEYLGAKERLCITPLTDRCYITLAQALGMHYGGAPAGPAGTGKTETVKDLGRSLGMYVVVTNCSEQHRYRDMAKLFKGICQSGCWGDFDEFNRIALEVLSVVAMQIEAIASAKKAGVLKFNFPGEPEPIDLVESCAYFITMNPGYAGRQELPENLKVLFRGVAMMVPDREIIIKVKLASVGYTEFDNLSKKFRILYGLCEEQLSKQRHYDFGLRNILSVLRTAGNTKRLEQNEKEELLLMRTLRDMNLSKLIADDQPLFESLLKDMFPKLADKAIPKKRYDDVEEGIKMIVAKKNLQYRDKWIIKIIQLYETSLVRHGFMLVGPTGVGKTTIMETLLDALSEVKVQHKKAILNPKAFTSEEMYGVMNEVSGEWTTGVFSAIWERFNSPTLKFHHWIVCDGPIDSLWIESLNTVLDDNKVLTLANNDRLSMNENTRIVFEVENMNNASPATVSRCGIIYVSETDLGWKPLIDTWLKIRTETKSYSTSDETTIINDLVNKYIIEPDLINIMEKTMTSVMEVNNCIRTTNLINLLSALLANYVQSGIDKLSIERMFVFALVWGFGGLFDPKDREKFHKFLEDRKAPMPTISAQKSAVDNMTIYEYGIGKDKNFHEWEPEKWKPPKKMAFSQLLIPTTDSACAEHLIALISDLPRSYYNAKCVLLLGETGTAKTSTILMYSDKFKENMLLKRVNFSSLTTPKMFQDSIENEVERRTGKTYEPPAGKLMTVFIDDISMPFVNEWGDQVTLENVRHLITSNGFYFLNRDQRGDFKTIRNLQFLGAMGHPGAGRNDIPNRLKRQFFSFNMVLPSQRSIDGIYGMIMRAVFNAKSKYSHDVIKISDLLIEPTIKIWRKMQMLLKPTPAKFHYIFNIRELSRVFQGVLRVTERPQFQVIQKCSAIGTSKLKPDLFMVLLWRHEAQRVFMDKLTNAKDKGVFKDTLDKISVESFKVPLGLEEEEDKIKQDILFCDFLREDIINENEELVEHAPKVYEAIPSMDHLKKVVEEKIRNFNSEPRNKKKIEMVLFDDALKHLLRINRLIQTPRGSAMLVGVGGSGKQSLTKLAAVISEQEHFQITLSKGYNVDSLFKDLEPLYRKAGPEGKSVTFIITDAEIKQESFLEYISSVLSTGEVAGLIPKDQKDAICVEIKNLYMKEPGVVKGEDPTMLELYNYFINRVRDCLHIVLAFSPVGNKFRERFRRFPAIFNSCTIDWFLPWPMEALEDVSHHFLQKFTIESSGQTKFMLEKHMGTVHQKVTEVCGQYFHQMRRHVYVTPKSYLSFINLYQQVYTQKYEFLNNKEGNVRIGLKKLDEGAQGVEKLKIELNKENEKLKEANEKTEKLLVNLEKETKIANEKKEQVRQDKESCAKTKAQIEIDKEEANKELEQALPFLHQAENALKKLTKKALQELKTFKAPAGITRLVLDGVQILFHLPLVPVREKQVKIGHDTYNFIGDSCDEYTMSTLKKDNFLGDLFEFSNNEKDFINEETCELLEPYLNLEYFNGDTAKKAAAALEGLCIWVDAMRMYHIASKIVNPKMAALSVQTERLRVAEEKLSAAEGNLRKAEAFLEGLKKQHKEQMDERDRIKENANRTKRKADQAQRLITGLQDEKNAWTVEANEFADQKKRLIGDVALACSFISYCGPFNSEFRKILREKYFTEDLVTKDIPYSSKDFNVLNFLVDEATKGEWSLQSLPSDDLSIENALMVTKSSRFPLLIDPQGQAIKWILMKEPTIEKNNCLLNINNPSMKDRLKIPLMDGMPVLIEGIENEVDPLLDPILEKQYFKKGSQLCIMFGDQETDYDLKFALFLTTKLANPHFSPELAAKTTIIDFTVTLMGLEQQLLGKVISKEQRSLEEQLNQLLEEVTKNTKTMQDLNEQLLSRLSHSQKASLLDDMELIDVLNNIKIKKREVQTKLSDASEKKIEISEKRKQYAPVSTRGAVLYFCVVDMSLVDWMYNTSLQQFLELFDWSIDNAPKAQLTTQRVERIIETLTYKVYRYICRGLFEKDKVTFLLMVCLKKMIVAGKITVQDVGMFLKAGAGIDERSMPQSEVISQTMWNNAKALSKHKFNVDAVCFFRDLCDLIQRSQPTWEKWIKEVEPENIPIPDYQDRITSEKDIGDFLHLCLVRCIREDRTVLESANFIKNVLGPEYVKPVPDSYEDLVKESKANIPILFLLSAGADPTASLDELARKKKVVIEKISMGEEQDKLAIEHLKTAFQVGSWVILQNCHLGLDFMAQLEDILNPKNQTIDEGFRLFLTSEPNDKFPLGLLQMSIKVTTEPPKGLKAGLIRTFNTIINQDFMDKVDPLDTWKSLVYTTCFLHSIVQERRKFGPLGFCIPYEFNNSDLEASLTFLERHISATLNQMNWSTIKYMICQVQYGGRITDDLDRELFAVYGDKWYKLDTLKPDFLFNHPSSTSDVTYKIPKDSDVVKIREELEGLPDKDSPEIFGLHSNADLTFRTNESKDMLSTLLNTQPKDTGAASGKSREEEVKEKLEKEIEKLPPDFVEIEYNEKIRNMSMKGLKDRGRNVPLNMFLFQEIQRFQMVLSLVRKMMKDIIDAVDGIIIMTPDIVDAIDAISTLRVPKKWLYDPTGNEISWLTSTLGAWLKGLADRHLQLNNWLNGGGSTRPKTFWMGGFFNPQGFLTAMKQEVTRLNKSNQWSLDDVHYTTEIQNQIISLEKENVTKKALPPLDAGVYVHGLYLEGANYNLSTHALEDYKSQKLYPDFPVVKFSAMSSSSQDGGAGANPKTRNLDNKSVYSCPIYKYAARTDRYLITRIDLKCDSGGVAAGNNPSHWKLRGVALLCHKD